MKFEGESRETQIEGAKPSARELRAKPEPMAKGKGDARIAKGNENRNTSTMRSFKIFSRWRHILFSISQFNNHHPNPKPNKLH